MKEILSLKLEEYFESYTNEIYRIVEGQLFIATRKLVDNDEEHRILEEIIDQSKPPCLTCNSRGELHYLLYTPFRYPPLKSGCRFHTCLEKGIFYGSEELTTAMSEISYHRFLEMKHHPDIALKPMQVAYTHFVAKVQSTKMIALTNKPFCAQRDKISDPASYAYSQQLGDAMRRAGTEMFRYFSARTTEGINVGLFSTEAFRNNKPDKEKHWDVYISCGTIEFRRADLTSNQELYVFKREDFL
jgi:hypothetical protein